MIQLPFDPADITETAEVDQFDDGAYKFILYMYNEDGRVVKLRKGAISQLVIEDNLLTPFHYGYLIYDNPHDVIERSTFKTVNDTKQHHQAWRYRGDCRDFIRFEMHPVIDSELMTAEKVAGPKFSLVFDFVVYDIEDLPAEDPTKKQKKILFRDLRMQTMMERDLYWSSAQASIRQKQVTHSRPISQLSNGDRSILTGIGIKDIIQQSLNNQKFTDNWDVGGNKKYYSTPTGYKSYDDMNVMLSNHVSTDETDYQPCILRFERFINKWSLLPISYYFTNAVSNTTKEPGKLQIESLFLPNEMSFDETPTGVMKTPMDNSKTMGKNVHLPDLSNITSYVYSDMPGEMNQQLLISTPIHAYTAENRQFMFYYEQQGIESMYDFFKQKVTGNLLGSTTGPHTEFFINNTKRQNLNVNALHSTFSDDISPLIESRNRVMEQALFNSGAINFVIKGSTMRRAGRFISIERNNSYTENDFDAKLLGQYMTTRVTHNITQSGYTNSIIAAKPYYYSKVDYNNNIR